MATASCIPCGRHTSAASGRNPQPTRPAPHTPCATIASADVSHTSMHPGNLRLILRKKTYCADMKTSTFRQDSTEASPSLHPESPQPHTVDTRPPYQTASRRRPHSHADLDGLPLHSPPSRRATSIAGRHSACFLGRGSHTRRPAPSHPGTPQVGTNPANTTIYIQPGTKLETQWTSPTVNSRGPARSAAGGMSGRPGARPTTGDWLPSGPTGPSGLQAHRDTGRGHQTETELKIIFQRLCAACSQRGGSGGVGAARGARAHHTHAREKHLGQPPGWTGRGDTQHAPRSRSAGATRTSH